MTTLFLGIAGAAMGFAVGGPAGAGIGWLGTGLLGGLLDPPIVGETVPEIVTLPRSAVVIPSAHCQYCRRARTNLTDNCLSCGAPPS